MSISEKPLVVVALATEDQGQIQALGFDVIYCGVGKVNATYHLAHALHRTRVRYPYVLNLGSAGSPIFKAGTLVEADRFVQRDMDAQGLGFTLGETPFDTVPPLLTSIRRFEQLPFGICGSGDSFLQSASTLPCDIIDMEAYALAKVCLKEELPFCSVKYITDGADGLASNDWQENLKNASYAFTTLLRAM
jgi:adenosylhomocysteine nucleosidase